MKVGVVGTGLAGLSVAWLLAQEGHEVTVFEKNRTIGFDSHSLDIKVGGKDYRVDVPLRMFDETYYKNLSAFYSKVGINYERGDYCQSYGYHSGEGADSENTGIYFRYYNHLIGTYSLPFVKGINVFSVTFLKIAFDALRLYCLAPFHLRDKKVEKMTFGEYLRSHNYSNVFIDTVLLPAVSAMCTCSYEDAQNYPAFILLTYFTRRAFNGIRRVTGGSKEVIEKISKQFSAIHCNTPVNSVYPSTEKGKVVVVDTNNVEYTFDHVVLATQANHASSILKKSSNKLIDTLKTFEYVKGAVFVHTDTNIMPKVVTDWGNVHFGFIKNSNYPVASIWLNSVMKSLHNDAIDVFQTVYPSQNMVEPSKLLGVMNFERPIMNETTVQALQALKEYQGKDNIWFCGAHAIYGVPLLENAVKSGVYVAQQLGCKVPWNVSQLEFGPQMPNLPPLLKYIGAIVFVVLLSILFGLLYI